MRLEEFVKFFEEHGFSVYDVSEFSSGQSPICWEIETWSDAGEDLIETIQFNGSVKELREELLDIWRNFCIEEHVEMLLEAKRNGMQGVPDAVTLVEDAQKIDKMYEKLYDDFYYTFC